MNHRLQLLFVSPLSRLRRGIHPLWAMQNREREWLAGEIQQMRGLWQLLTARRNGHRWTELERREIRTQLRRLAEMSPYLILFVSPGGFFALPVLVWWLDRRRQRHDADSAADASGNATADSPAKLVDESGN